MDKSEKVNFDEEEVSPALPPEPKPDLTIYDKEDDKGNKKYLYDNSDLMYHYSEFGGES